VIVDELVLGYFIDLALRCVLQYGHGPSPVGDNISFCSRPTLVRTTALYGMSLVRETLEYYTKVSPFAAIYSQLIYCLVADDTIV
jgi:hypothetical protein